MELTLTTPALLFPAISLMMLAYTNRFLAIARLMRDLHARYRDDHSQRTKDQLDILRRRIILIKNMQIYSVGSFFGCVLCMFILFAGFSMIAKFVFGGSVISLLVSLWLSLKEVQVSTDALMLQVDDLDEKK